MCTTYYLKDWQCLDVQCNKDDHGHTSGQADLETKGHQKDKPNPRNTHSYKVSSSLSKKTIYIFIHGGIS